MAWHRSANLLVGLALLAIGLLFYASSLGLAAGTAAAMGPAFVPRLTAVVLALLGTLIIAADLRGEREVVSGWAIRPALLITASALVFAITLESLGVLAATALSLVVSCFAGARRPPREWLLLVLVTPPLVAALFVWGLGLLIPLWPSFGGR